MSEINNNNKQPLKQNKKKKQKKQSKEDKYKSLLDQIDIQLDDKNAQQKRSKSALQEYMDQNNQAIEEDNQEISINDLMGRLEDANNQVYHGVNDQEQKDNKNEKKDQENFQKPDKKDTQNMAHLRKQMEDLSKKKTLQEPESIGGQEQKERIANYQIIKEDMTQWIPIVKKNREADHLDFTRKENVDNLRVNTVMGTDLSHNIAQTIEGTLKKSNLESETSVKNKNKPLTNQQKKLLAEKNLMFYKELKHKRVAKIKSKMYHRIKNKKLKRQQADEQVNVEQLEEEQVRERIQQRHKTKSKSLRSIIRYGDKKQAQQAVTANSEIRKQILQKIMQLDEQDPDEYDPDDDNAFREKAIQELEKELIDDEDEDGENPGQKKKKTGLKFIDDFNEQRRGEALEQAKVLLEKLKNNDDLDNLFSEEEMENEDEEDDLDGENKSKKRKNEKSKEEQDEEFVGRKKYVVTDEQKKKDQFELDMDEAEEIQKQNEFKKQNVGSILNKYIKNNEDKEFERLNEKNQDFDDSHKNPNVQIDEQEENIQNLAEKSTKDIKKSNKNKNLNNQNTLTSGINLDGLKEKYKKNLKGAEFDQKDLETFDQENKDEIYNDLENFNILVDDENEEEFNKEKYEDYEKDLPQQPKKSVGWGSWTGAGIAAKPEPSPEEQLRKKQMLINSIKKKREDGSLHNVIKRDTRNKAVANYLVKELPYQFKNKDQFNYLNSVAIGSEWNTLKSTQNLIRPKIKTKAGQIINPIKAPKKSKVQI